MKRFNIDEFIWFIILIMITLCICFLIKSGEITNFVGSDMIKYFYISIAILIIFSVFQFSRIFTVSSKNEITNKFIPLIFTLIIGVALFFVMPLINKDDADNFYDDLILYYNVDAIIINNENYELLSRINEEKEKFKGKTIVFLGYIDEKTNSNEAIISREKISCCQADKEKIEIKVKGIDKSLEEGQWINIVGKISFDNGFYVEVNEYKLQNQPKDIYYHELL